MLFQYYMGLLHLLHCKKGMKYTVRFNKESSGGNKVVIFRQVLAVQLKM